MKNKVATTPSHTSVVDVDFDALSLTPAYLRKGVVVAEVGQLITVTRPAVAPARAA